MQTRSLLIKYGLKLTIESKRKQSAGDSSGNETSKSNRKDTINSMDTSDDDDEDDDDQKSPKNGVIKLIEEWKLVFKIRGGGKYSKPIP